MSSAAFPCEREPAPASREKHGELSRSRELVAMSLASAAGALALLWFVEWPYYQKWLGEQSAGGLNSLLVHWTIWSKSMLLMVPALMLAAICLWFHRHRTAWCIWAAWGAALATVICLDAHVFDRYGRHLTTVISFATEPQAIRWIGGLTRWIMPVVVPAIAAAAVLAALGWGTRGVAHRIVRRRRRTWLAIVALMIAMPLGLRHYVSAALFERTCELLPLTPQLSGEAAGQRTLDDPALHALDHLARVPLHNALPRALQPAPLDTNAVFTATPQSPNVIILVLESFNWDLDGYELMPKLAARARSGLRAQRHYSGGNHSDVGLFSILYGQPGLCYEPTLQAPVVPQMLHSFAESGYQTRYFSSAAIEWMLMERYLRAFQSREITADRGDVEGDLESMRLLARAVNERGDEPLFAMAFLMSTHTPFSAPPQYDSLHAEVPEAKRAAPELAADQADAYSRYLRATRFLDDEIDRFLESIDLTRNIVVICGDHGESLYDDGVFSHYSRLSDAQTRTPLIILGPGIPARRITTATSHADLLPTLLHAAAGRAVPTPMAYGQDLLAEELEERHLLVTTVVRNTPVMLALIQPHDDERLLFTVDVASSNLRLYSFAGADGAAGITSGHTDAHVESWADALQQQIERLGRVSPATAAR